MMLTLHGGSSPRDSQANSLMSCVFQDCCLAPEGGAPADWTWHASWRGVGSLNDPPLVAHGTLIQGALLLLPLGTTYQGTRKRY